jgi:hypothetical protein
VSDPRSDPRLQQALDFAGRRLTPEDARAAFAAPISEAERQAARELIHWFVRRYPTPLERLTYARQAYARWTAVAGVARHLAAMGR